MPRKKTTENVKTTAKKPRKTVIAKKMTTLPSNSGNYSEEVRHRAYELYVEKGAWSGGDLADWLEAEKQVKDKYSMA